VTCTLGEEGEVLVDDLAHLAPDQVDGLGQHRLGELKNAMDILGVTDFIRLGGDGRYRDSRMAYDARGRAIARDVLREGIFWTADHQDAANELVPLIRDRKPPGADHLQPDRRIRPSRSHPGAPDSHVRRAAGRSAELSARSGCRGDRRYVVGRPQTGRDARPCHSDRRGWPVLRRVTAVGREPVVKEAYLFAAGVPFPDSDGWADDLFAGLD
jgi:hypothetical protein